MGLAPAAHRPLSMHPGRTLGPMRTPLLFLASLLSPFWLQAQIDGDNIFSIDQVISVNLDFPQANFWTQLQDHYNADQNEYIVAFLTLTDVSGTHAIDSVGVRLKGNSSYSHPGTKKSFKIDFNKYISGQNYDGLKKLNFSNGFKDPSCMREKLFFDVCREANVPAPRASFAEVTFNGDPWGFYTVVEQIDDQFLDWNILEDDGNLFKAGDNFGGGPPGAGGNTTAANLVYYGEDQASYEDRYELKSNEDLNDWSDLISLLDFVNNTDNAAFEAGIDFRIEVDAFLRSAAMDMLFSNLDTYTGSARNYYLYHNQETNLWEWIKWDANEAFGSYTNGAGNMETLALDYCDSPRPLLQRMLDDPDLYQRYLQQVCYLTAYFFNEADLHARIDEVRDLIAPSVYADDNKMYSSADFNTNIEADLSGGGPGPMGGQTYGLKPFVTNRAAYIAGELDCSTLSISDERAPEWTVFPNPASKRVTVVGSTAYSANLTLRNALGQTVRTVNTEGTSEFTLDLQGLSQGVYFLDIASRGALHHQRLLVD